MGVALVAATLSAGGMGSAGAATAPSQPWTWGANGFGQLGNGTVSASPAAAAAVAGLSDIIDVHGGREHVAALSSGGTVHTWGSNVEGQLGLGDSSNRSRPTAVPVPCGTSKVVAVETGHNSTLALCGNGAVWAWGLNADGQLGDGTLTLRRAPVQVRGLTDAVAIAAGRDMAYAIRAGGTVVAWGDNAFGELGDGTTTDRTTPVPVAALTGVTAIAGGRNHALALRADGSVWAFGANAYGQLGDGTTVNRATPVRVTALGSEVTDVIAGAHHSYALRSDGAVVSWGRNYRAQLGDGTTTNRTTPVAVGGVTGAVSIGAGRDHGVAVLASGEAVAWGNNAQGQLGDGTTATRSRAVTVPGVRGASKAGGGGAEYSVVLVSDGAGPAPNSPPTARVTASCQQRTCTFDGRGSSDGDGAIAAYSWDFGDVTAATATATHTFPAPGTYPVSLTVTDDDGSTGSATTQVTVSDAPASTVAFRARATFDGNAIAPTVTVPTSAAPQDRLLLFVSTNRNGSAATPAGWSLLGSAADGTDLRSWVFSRSAGATAGTSVRVALDAYGKTNLTLLAYAGAGEPSAVAGAPETGTSASHRTPPAAVTASGSTVVSFWTDKVSTTHGWSLPANVTSRSATAGSGTGMLTTAAGDTSTVASGQWPGATAQAGGVPSSKALGWTVVLPPS